MMEASSSVPSEPAPAVVPTTRTLKYRSIRESDTDALVAMRIACGWGLHRIPGYFTDPDQVIWLFFYDGEGGAEEMVGMGGILLEYPSDPELASREKKIIELTALFLYPKYQGSGLGNYTLDILEALAIERYGCETLSLDTLAYQKLEDNIWPGGGPDGKGEMSKTAKWYLRRGYKEFRPMSPKYPKLNDGDLTPVYLGRCMHKPAVSTEVTRRLAAALLP